MISKIIKDYNQPQKPEVRVRVGRFAGIVGIIANILLFSAKLIFGLMFKSISIIADSLNNLSDSGSNVITVVGYTMSGKPADKDHPYGHERIEYISSLIIAIFIAFFGFETMISSIEKIVSPPSETEPFSLISMIVIGATIMVKLLIALFYRKMGKHIGSDTLKASALDSIGDVFATGAVLVGMIIFNQTGFIYTDSIIGIIIALYIIIMGIKLVIETSSQLIGKAPDADFTFGIIKKIKKYDGVLGIHDLVVHSYGKNRCFCSAHVEVDSDIEVMHSHDLIDTIEADFLKEGINLVIHMDPISVSDPETNELRAKCLEIIAHFSSECQTPISMHDFRVVKGFSHTNVIFDISISNDAKMENKVICEELTERIKKINPCYNLVLTIDRDYFSERYGE
ncbi:MAG: cation transporter [Clostridia bacterium]|nr:cation transporter [Clostridia bacterium]